jgi:hypothetical protein
MLVGKPGLGQGCRNGGRLGYVVRELLQHEDAAFQDSGQLLCVQAEHFRKLHFLIGSENGFLRTRPAEQVVATLSHKTRKYGHMYPHTDTPPSPHCPHLHTRSITPSHAVS